MARDEEPGAGFQGDDASLNALTTDGSFIIYDSKNEGDPLRFLSMRVGYGGLSAASREASWATKLTVLLNDGVSKISASSSYDGLYFVTEAGARLSTAECEDRPHMFFVPFVWSVEDKEGWHTASLHSKILMSSSIYKHEWLSGVNPVMPIWLHKPDGTTKHAAASSMSTQIEERTATTSTAPGQSKGAILDVRDGRFSLSSMSKHQQQSRSCSDISADSEAGSDDVPHDCVNEEGTDIVEDLTRAMWTIMRHSSKDLMFYRDIRS